MFDKLRGRIREWSKNHPAPTDQPPQKVTHSKYETLEKPESRSIATSTRTRWITFGLNRHERRAIVAKIKRILRKYNAKNVAEILGGPNTKPTIQLPNVYRYPGSRKHVVPNPDYSELSWLRFQITNSPRNWPSNGGSNNPVFEGTI